MVYELGKNQVEIATGQYAANLNKLRMDLFDRRMKIYEALMKFVATIVQRANITQDDLFEFSRGTKDAVFLFDDEIVKYTKEVYDRGVDVMSINAELENLPVGDVRKAAIEKKRDLMIWFSSQFETSKTEFGKFLSLKEIR